MTRLNEVFFFTKNSVTFSKKVLFITFNKRVNKYINGQFMYALPGSPIFHNSSYFGKPLNVNHLSLVYLDNFNEGNVNCLVSTIIHEVLHHLIFHVIGYDSKVCYDDELVVSLMDGSGFHE